MREDPSHDDANAAIWFTVQACSLGLHMVASICDEILGRKPYNGTFGWRKYVTFCYEYDGVPTEKRDLSAVTWFGIMMEVLNEYSLKGIGQIAKTGGELTSASRENVKACGMEGLNAHEVTIHLAGLAVAKARTVLAEASGDSDGAFSERVKRDNLRAMCEAVRFLNTSELGELLLGATREHVVAVGDRWGVGPHAYVFEGTEKENAPCSEAGHSLLHAVQSDILAPRPELEASQTPVEGDSAGTSLTREKGRIMAGYDDLAERFPLVGHGLPPVRFKTPRDADWLPQNWESPDYPKGMQGSDNTEAILQWLSYETWCYEERLIPVVDHPDLADERGRLDRGGPVRDAYRLVEQLRQGRSREPAPPTEPGRGYMNYREDLMAAVAELKKVLEWLSTCPASKGGAVDETRGKPKPKRKRRRLRSDPKADRKLAQAWATARYKTYAELALEKGLKTIEVARALDRHRKRESRKSKGWNRALQ